MKVWVCKCGFKTFVVESAIRHTKNNGHIMALKDIPDASRYSVSLETGS